MTAALRPEPPDAGPDDAPSYDGDFHAWALRQAELLRAGRLAEADLPNLIEEIESLARTERRELASRLAVLLAHLTKWRMQPERRGRSWENTIRHQRSAIADELEEQPSLKTHLNRLFLKAWIDGRRGAADEMDMDLRDLPAVCPFTLDEALDDDFWPEPR